MLDLIEILFSRHGIRSLRFDGKMDRAARDTVLATFKKAGGPKVILIRLVLYYSACLPLTHCFSRLARSVEVSGKYGHPNVRVRSDHLCRLNLVSANRIIK